MRGSEFVFDSIDLLHYNLHKISLNRDGSYIDSLKWLTNKKATINPMIDFPSHKKDWKKFEKTINQLFLIFYMCLKN